MASLNTNTPPPEAEASVKVLSSIPRGRFSLTGGVTTSRHGASTTFPTDSMNSLPPDDLSGGNGTPNESLEAHPSNAASRVDFLSSLPFEVSIYILLLADAFDVARWRGVCTTWNILCSDNQVWRDHFHRNPAWRVRPDLLKAVEDQQTSKACASRLSHVDDLADDAEEPIHLATPTKNSSSRAKAASRHSNPTGQSQSSSPRKKSGVSTSDLLGLTTDLSGLRIGPSSSPTLQRQHQHVSDTLSFSSTEASFSTPARPKSGSIGSPHFNPSQPVPSPYFIKPLKAPLRGLNWMELYRTRHQIDERWKLGQSKTSVLRGHRDNIYCIRSDSDYIITGSRDPSVKIWDLKTQTCKHTIEGMPTSVLCLDHDGNELVFGSSDASIHIYSMKTWTLQRRLLGHSAGVLDVSLGEHHIASSSKDCTMRIWDRKTGEVLKVLREHDGAVNALGLKGDQLLSAGGDNQLKLWSIPSGKVIRTFVGHERGLACFAWDGNRCVSGGNDRTIRIWDVNTGECLRVLKGHTELVRCLTFNDKSNRIVSGSYDRTVRVWDAETGDALVEYRGGTSSYVFGVTMDSSRIITCSHDKRVIILDFGYDLDVSPFV